MFVSCILEVLDSNAAANTPRTNLSESKHGSWLAGEGQKDKISLYDAAVSDMTNALLQSAKQHAYITGKHLGAGPSLKNLLERSSSKTSFNPATVSQTVHKVVTGTPMYHNRTNLEGERETMQQKRRPSLVVDIDDDSSHRPEFIQVTKERKERGRPKKIIFQADGSAPGQGTEVPNTSGALPQTGDFFFQDKQEVVERVVHDTFWAIRRTNIGSRVKCLGWIPKSGKCNRAITNSSKGTPAPCFFSTRSHPNGKSQQMMWFCNSDCTHTWNPEKNINPTPARLPSIWPVAEGTKLVQSEVEMLTAAGFQLEVKVASVSNVADVSGPKQGVGHNKADHSNTRDNKRPRHRTKVSKMAQARIEKALTLNASVLTEKVVLQSQHEIFEIETESSLKVGIRYDVHIHANPSCTCPDFQKRVVGRKPYTACKHIYFVFLRILGLDQLSNMFVHQASLSEAEVFQALTRERTYP